MPRRQYLTRPSPITVRNNQAITRTHSAEDANVLRKIGEYNVVYGSPASLADVAYEAGATERLDHAIINVIRKRQSASKRSVKRLARANLITRTIKGGYVLTEKGKRVLGRASLAKAKTEAMKEYGKIET